MYVKKVFLMARVLIISDNPEQASFNSIINLKKEILKTGASVSELFFTSLDSQIIDNIIYEISRNSVIVISLIKRNLIKILRNPIISSLLHKENGSFLVFIYGSGSLIHYISSQNSNLFYYPRSGVSKITSLFKNAVL